MKKLICTLFALAICASLAACGGSDTPAETTNSASNTTTNSDSIEENVGTTTNGAAHEHTFVNATCQAPKTCSECGETEGELGTHSYENKVCSVCGEKQTSEGLQFMLNDAGDGYIVIGIGNCVDLDIVIPAIYEGNPVTEIGEEAFFEVKTITSVTIPDGLTIIADRAFGECMRLKSVALPNSITSVGNYSFGGCGALTSITIPDSVTSIGNSAFSACASLTSITIPDSITSIGESAFYKCSGLVSITIPDSVTSIGTRAFDRCTGLTSVTIGNGVVNIGYQAFGECDALTEVHINDLAAWCKIAYEDHPMSVISACTANPLFYGATLYVNNEVVTDLVIPEGVTSIEKNAFYGCTTIKSITIPDSVTSIGESVFAGCGTLTSIYCEADSLPLGWDGDWLENCPATIYWGGEWEYVDGVPTVK